MALHSLLGLLLVRKGPTTLLLGRAYLMSIERRRSDHAGLEIESYVGSHTLKLRGVGCCPFWWCQSLDTLTDPIGCSVSMTLSPIKAL